MITKINENTNIFNDNIGFVEQWDFSKANMSQENRIKAITLIASICYQNPKALNSESLYNRLAAESAGLPSSSFEFVPILFTDESIKNLKYLDTDELILPSILKFGEMFQDEEIGEVLLTNYRAIVYDVENGILHEDCLKIFNTEEECKIIAKHFKVFKYKVDLSTRSQMVRHRVSWQELSRRYVSGKKMPFEFYVSDKMENIRSQFVYGFINGQELSLSTDVIIDICIRHYDNALDKGIKPEEARRILPQGLYTEIWGAFQPTALENFYKLRLDRSAQHEIRLVAEAMKELENTKK